MRAFRARFCGLQCLLGFKGLGFRGQCFGLFSRQKELVHAVWEVNVFDREEGRKLCNPTFFSCKTSCRVAGRN